MFLGISSQEGSLCFLEFQVKKELYVSWNSKLGRNFMFLGISSKRGTLCFLEFQVIMDLRLHEISSNNGLEIT
jgi:hypothetical protein